MHLSMKGSAVMEQDIHLSGAPSPVPADVASRGSGRHKFTVAEDSSVEVVAVVEDGKIKGYEGLRDGKPAETFILRVRREDTAPTNEQALPTRCFICFINGGVHCFEVSC